MTEAAFPFPKGQCWLLFTKHLKNPPGSFEAILFGKKGGVRALIGADELSHLVKGTSFTAKAKREKERGTVTFSSKQARAVHLLLPTSVEKPIPLRRMPARYLRAAIEEHLALPQKEKRQREYHYIQLPALELIDPGASSKEARIGIWSVPRDRDLAQAKKVAETALSQEKIEELIFNKECHNLTATHTDITQRIWFGWPAVDWFVELSNGERKWIGWYFDGKATVWRERDEVVAKLPSVREIFPQQEEAASATPSSSSSEDEAVTSSPSPVPVETPIIPTIDETPPPPAQQAQVKQASHYSFGKIAASLLVVAGTGCVIFRTAIQNGFEKLSG